MAPVDEAWLRMESRLNPMVVAALMELEDVSDLPAFATELARRLLRHDRFRQRVDSAGSSPVWVDDGEPNLAYHLRAHPPQGDEATLRRVVAHEAEQALDLSMPLWRVDFFPRAGTRVLVLFRVHHAMADGIALMRLLMDVVHDQAPSPQPARRQGPLRGLIEALDFANSAFEDVRRELAEELRHPDRIPRQLQSLRRAAGAISRMLSLRDNNPPSVRAPLSGHRAAAWTTGLSLDALRSTANEHDCTINDVLLAALAGAFGSALRARGVRVPRSQNLRVVVPVNLRADGFSERGNHFGLVLADLPIGVEERERRIRIVAGRMKKLKDSMEARAVLAALGAVGHLPAGIEKRLVELVATKAAVVVSNLPGPRERLRFAGARVADMAFWPPRTAGVGIGIGMLSYAGRVSIGISSDQALQPDPSSLLEALRAELSPTEAPGKPARKSPKDPVSSRPEASARSPR